MNSLTTTLPKPFLQIMTSSPSWSTISFSDNSASNISSDSSFFHTYKNNSTVDTIELLQTQNLNAFINLLDDWQTFSNLTRLIDAWTAFHWLMTLDHLHTTIQWLEKEIQIQEAKATIVLDQLIKEKFCKHLHQHFWLNQQNLNHWQQKFTPLLSPMSSISSFQYPEPEPSPPPLPVLPPLGTWLNPIIVDDDSNKEFLMREGRSGQIARIVDDWDKLSNAILNCQMWWVDDPFLLRMQGWFCAGSWHRLLVFC